MVRKGINVLLIGLGLMVFSEQAKALCKFDASKPINATKTLTMPVNVTIAVTPGLNVWQKVYDQNILLANPSEFAIDCDATGPFYYEFGLETSMSETSAGSKVYKTNLQGIGVKFGVMQGTIPTTVPVDLCLNAASSCDWNEGYNAYSWLELFKTENTVAPGTINAGTLPVIVYSAGQQGSMVKVYRIKMTGTITVTVPTCNISAASQAMTVKMGEHKLSSFKGVGSYTGWVDASIYLEGCGQFYGYGNNTNATFDGSTVITQNPLVRNAFSVTLTPRYGVAAGAMKLKEQSLGAVGFGIQLSRSKSDAGVLDLTTASYKYSDPLPNNGSTRVTVPLYTRYIQTAKKAVAGKADGMLEYTVNYN